MASTITGRLKHAWNAFRGEETRLPTFDGHGASYSIRPDRVRLNMHSDKSIIGSIYTRIGIDVAAVDMMHVRLDENRRYVETINSGLNYCLTVEANIDQAARAFRQDAAMTMFDEGVIAIVPIETSVNPISDGGYDIRNVRVGRIVTWYPEHVTVNVYNEKRGTREDITLPKRLVAIAENPLYSVMNEPNGTLQRLIRKLSLLDAVDEASGSGKLDLIIQLPYVIKSEARKQQAEQRAKDIEFQLKGSKYGIAYTDGTEKITQLNRPAENNLLAQVEFLTEMLYSQLGITKEVFTGEANEQVMLNYHNRTIEPILTAITQAMRRTFLTKTARTQGHSIEFFRNPFSLVALSDIAEIADKFTRNEVLSSNEIRSIVGMKPADDPKADELRNKNLPISDEPLPAPVAN